VQKKKEKWVPPKPTRIGKKRKKNSGPQAAYKLPAILPVTKCKLRLLRLERIKDFLLLEEEFLTNQQALKPREAREEEEKSMVDEIRGSPMSVGTVEEIINDDHAIISGSGGPEYYVNIMSFVDKDQLEPGSTVLMHNKQMSIVGLLGDDVDPMVNVMKVESAPTESYADIGGLQKQIQEVKEAVELPMTHPELYEDIGIKPPKGVIFFGPPGTGVSRQAYGLGRSCWLLVAAAACCFDADFPLFDLSSPFFQKTLLAKAVANETSATFLRVVGSELIQKYLGDGPKLVRELFRVADEHAPSIVFIDEIDAVGTKRYDSSSGGEREIQRTMLELLNQLDGFDARGEVKVIMATNRIETLDPALIRPGRIDRKIEFPLPDIPTRRMVFRIHTGRMALNEDVDLEEFISSKDDLSGADIKASQYWSERHLQAGVH
jgi:26S proteasome regulatory subunit T2